MSITYTWNTYETYTKYNDNLVCYIPMTDSSHIQDVIGNYRTNWQYSPSDWTKIASNTTTVKLQNVRNRKAGIGIADSKSCKMYITKNNSSISVDDPTTAFDRCTIKMDFIYTGAGTWMMHSEGTTNGIATKMRHNVGTSTHNVWATFCYESTTTKTSTVTYKQSDHMRLIRETKFSGSNQDWMTMVTQKHSDLSYTFSLIYKAFNIDSSIKLAYPMSNTYKNTYDATPTGKFKAYHIGQSYYPIHDEGDGSGSASYAAFFRIYNSDDSWYIHNDDLELHTYTNTVKHVNSSEYNPIVNRIVVDDNELSNKYLRCYQYR